MSPGKKKKNGYATTRVSSSSLVCNRSNFSTTTTRETRLDNCKNLLFYYVLYLSAHVSSIQVVMSDIDKMIFTYKNTLQKRTMQLTSSTPGARSKNNNRRNKLLSWVYVVRRNRGPTFPAICTTLDAARAYGLCRADAARHGRYR
jgi:hypothetical protein